MARSYESLQPGRTSYLPRYAASKMGLLQPGTDRRCRRCATVNAGQSIPALMIQSVASVSVRRARKADAELGGAMVFDQMRAAATSASVRLG